MHCFSLERTTLTGSSRTTYWTSCESDHGWHPTVSILDSKNYLACACQPISLCCGPRRRQHLWSTPASLQVTRCSLWQTLVYELQASSHPRVGTVLSRTRGQSSSLTRHGRSLKIQSRLATGRAAYELGARASPVYHAYIRRPRREFPSDIETSASHGKVPVYHLRR